MFYNVTDGESEKEAEEEGEGDVKRERVCVCMRWDGFTKSFSCTTRLKITWHIIAITRT